MKKSFSQDKRCISERLKLQAEIFREQSQKSTGKFYEIGPSAWKRTICLLVFFATVCLGIWFFMGEDHRRQGLISEGKELWKIAKELSGKILATPVLFSIPGNSKVSRRPQSTITSENIEGKGAAVPLFKGSEPSRAVTVVGGRGNPRTPHSKAAYELLKEKSEIVKDLARNDLPNWHLKSWNPVKDHASECWIDLVVFNKVDREEVHLIFSIDTGTGQVLPLSQAARDFQLIQK